MFDMGRHRLFWIVVCAALVGVGIPTAAQAPKAPKAPAAPEAPAPAPDPLGRESPFGTITGFSTAVHRNDLAVATRYLQRERRSTQQLDDLAHDLSDLLDRYFTGRLSKLSSASTGDLADGLDTDREAIRLDIGGKSVDLFLKRVDDPTAGLIWLVSSDSLSRVPSLRRSATATWIEQVMPASLVAQTYFGLSLAQWIFWASSILLPFLLFWTLAHVITWLARQRIADTTRRTLFLSSWSAVRRPLVIVVTLLTHLAVVRVLGLSVTFRYAYARLVLTIVVIVAALLTWRFVAISFQQARLLAIRRGRSSTRSLIQLGERVVKVLVVLVAMFALLALGGVDPTTALAGVGIVGVAFALGAQKSVENLLGGVSLLTDRALAVGDFCRLSDREGWVEDITLRSVRLRTLEQTMLCVPAGVLAQANIENYTTRGKILLQSVLRLRYGATSDQLNAVLDGTRQLLSRHASIEKDSARARLTSFGAQAIEIELFAYVLTADYAAFLEIRESLLLQVAQIVETSGAAFAIPTQFIYMRDGADSRLPAALTTHESRYRASAG
jgi:MscS family membrane protein